MDDTAKTTDSWDEGGQATQAGIWEVMDEEIDDLLMAERYSLTV